MKLAVVLFARTFICLFIFSNISHAAEKKIHRRPSQDIDCAPKAKKVIKAIAESIAMDSKEVTLMPNDESDLITYTTTFYHAGSKEDDKKTIKVMYSAFGPSSDEGCTITQIEML